jgi:hypothetical protein
LKRVECYAAAQLPVYGGAPAFQFTSGHQCAVVIRTTSDSRNSTQRCTIGWRRVNIHRRCRGESVTGCRLVVSKFTIGVSSPTLDATANHGTCRVHRCGDSGHAGQSDNINRRTRVGLCSVAKLSEFVLAPTLHGSCCQ